MYKIIGADGKEYGPIPADVLKKWIAEGRANAQTKVLPEGATEWVTVGQIPELSTTIPVIAAIPTTGTPAYGAATGEDLTTGPAIGLIVTAVLGFLWTGLGTLINLLGMGVNMNQPGMNPEMERIMTMFSGTLGIVSGVIGFLVAGLILFGALKMKKRQAYGWAMTASILSVVPCVSPCCLVGIPIGIWALIVLSKPEVKAQFQ